MLNEKLFETIYIVGLFKKSDKLICFLSSLSSMRGIELGQAITKSNCFLSKLARATFTVISSPNW